MGHLKDYVNRVHLKRGEYTIYSAPWERQFAVFFKGSCIATFSNRVAAIHAANIRRNSHD